MPEHVCLGMGKAALELGVLLSLSVVKQSVIIGPINSNLQLSSRLV